MAVTPGLLRRWPLPQPGGSADKEDRGVALVIGGASEVPGALLLSGLAALRVGAGKLQLVAPHSSATQLGVSVPEARVFALQESKEGFLDRKSARTVRDCARHADAILIGPGLLNEDATRDFVDEALSGIVDKPLVIDALAIAALQGGRHRFTESAGVVITPNQSEMAMLTGEKPKKIASDPLAVAASVARDLNVIVALKGPETLIATPDGEAFRYADGGVGLATSGSGDVLAGAVVGLLARGSEPDQAAVWATYLHGAAGNRLARRMGPLGFLARELSSELPALMNGLAAKRRR
ncbi:MAG TPA: NAD(P)H-hydrate dehydratase [Gemmatimonadaceae bacterium]|nr:NAD(P)H-hydrate dehydratase [Gemmatimonadaceae bacterium]